METLQISVGKLVATFGVKGALVLQHGLGDKTAFKGLNALWVEVQRGSKLPFFLETAKVKSDTETWVKLEGIDSREAAAALLQKQVWLNEADFKRYVSARATIALIGFTIREAAHDLGVVESVIEQPHQVIATITMQGKEVLIPLNEATLKNIDRNRQVIHVQLPEGLLEVYLT